MVGEEVMTEEMAGEEETTDMTTATEVIMETEVTMVVTGVIMAATEADMEEAAVINRYYQ